MTRFADCLPRILTHEGGWVDHPKDPGGATMKGVTLASYSDWLGRPASKAELRAIKPDVLAQIYERRYWLAADCDKLPPGVDYMVFDLAVNSGPARAKRFLQEAAGVVADGDIGPKTLAAVKAVGAQEMIERLANRRDRFFRSLPTFGTFGNGWIRRLQEVTASAHDMAQVSA